MLKLSSYGCFLFQTVRAQNASSGYQHDRVPLPGAPSPSHQPDGRDRGESLSFYHHQSYHLGGKLRWEQSSSAPFVGKSFQVIILSSYHLIISIINLSYHQTPTLHMEILSKHVSGWDSTKLTSYSNRFFDSKASFKCSTPKLPHKKIANWDSYPVTHVSDRDPNSNYLGT